MVKEIIISVDSQLCECGCGDYAPIGKRFIWGHNMKSKAAREKQSSKTSKEWEDGIHDLDGEKRTQFYIDNPGAIKDMSDLKKEQYKNGLKHPMEGKHHTDATKQKMSDNHWDNSGENHPMFGKHHTDEAKDKMSIAHKRENLSEETLQRMRDSHLGNKQTPETIEKIRESSTGRLHTNAAKDKIREASIGRTHTEESNQKNRDAHLGKRNTDESKEKNRIHMLKIRENQRWNAQVTNLINGTPITDWISRPSRHYDISQEAYNIWRRAVYERDLHTCRICGANHCLIHTHHIIPQRINQDIILDINNGITMCRTCHELTYGKEEIYSEELQMIVDGII